MVVLVLVKITTLPFCVLFVSGFNAQVVVITSSGTAVSGNTAIFSCLTYGSPLPTVTWTKDNVPLVNGSGIRSYTSTITDGGFVFVKATVEICDTNEFDAGVYRCSALNTLGSDSAVLTFTGT